MRSNGLWVPGWRTRRISRHRDEDPKSLKHAFSGILTCAEARAGSGPDSVTIRIVALRAPETSCNRVAPAVCDLAKHLRPAAAVFWIAYNQQHPCPLGSSAFLPHCTSTAPSFRVTASTVQPAWICLSIIARLECLSSRRKSLSLEWLWKARCQAGTSRYTCRPCISVLMRSNSDQHSGRLKELADALRSGWDASHLVSTLEEAIGIYQRLLELRPPGHEQRRQAVSDLGDAL
jgi:hypothetical protein